MQLWRISNHAELSGRGGLRAGGRWHSPGRPIVYTAEHPALALLEVLVHLEIESLAGLPSHYRLLCIEAPEDMLRETVSDALLGAGWRTDVARSRAIGDAWLRGGAAALLSVPSAVAPSSRNWLVNPSHRDAAKLAIAWAATYPFDERLVARRAPGPKG